jgi:hypothetical protein
LPPGRAGRGRNPPDRSRAGVSSISKSVFLRDVGTKKELVVLVLKKPEQKNPICPF